MGRAGVEFQLGPGVVLTPERHLPRGWVAVGGGRVRYVGDRPLEGVPAVELGEHTLVPGFIDLHVHGGGGFSLTSGDPAALEGFRRWVVRTGVTAFLASLVGPSPQALLETLGGPMPSAAPGAACLGFHLEGPFLNPRRGGALPPGWFRAPDEPLLMRLLQAAGGRVRMVTVAPELPGAMEVIRQLVRAGVVVALGHTDADYEQFMQGVQAGARHVTHCFNAMRGLHHREPGALGAALVAPVTAELIADGVHVHPAAAELLLRVKGPDGVVLVSDAVASAGLEEGPFETGGRSELGGQTVYVRQGRATLADGRLAGSLLTMDQAVRFVVERLGRPLDQAVRMATLNPARCLGLQATRGRIAEGYVADLVLLDGRFEVAATFVEGRLAFCREAEASMLQALAGGSGTGPSGPQAPDESAAGQGSTTAATG